MEIKPKSKFLTLYFLCFLLLTSCTEKKKIKHEILRPVHVSEAIKMTVPVYVSSFGYLTAEQSVDIKSQVTGRILECHFKQGEQVKKGELLFTIDPSLYKAALSKAEANLKKDMADLKMKKMIVDKDQGLVQHGAVSIQDYRQYETDLEKVIASIKYDQSIVENCRIKLQYCKIKSPISGVAGVRKVDPGNIVTANSGPTLVNIKTVDPLYLDFTIPEKNLLRLKNSMKKRKLKVLLFVDEFGIEKSIQGKVYTGTLKFFGNSIDHETATIFLRAVIPNKKNELWPGQFVRLFLILDDIKDAVLVPYQSVNRGLKGNYLFKINKSNRAELVYVKVGQKMESYIVIYDKDIKPGDKIVTVGQMGLAPDVKVKIVEEDSFPKPDFTEARNAAYSKIEKVSKKIPKKDFINKKILKNKNIPANQKQLSK
ncbi:MAG: efflux RND transporter periplasmic adaptor subunit [Victivallales bacterium]|nr:efflux RND transporter periplasmic adaptor subunit [Victivallales bacterium]MCF7889116.1 efflux RND transporter periplasmic adaptor subunit [Victivallales bacterium]